MTKPPVFGATEGALRRSAVVQTRSSHPHPSVRKPFIDLVHPKDADAFEREDLLQRWSLAETVTTTPRRTYGRCTGYLRLLINLTMRRLLSADAEQRVRLSWKATIIKNLVRRTKGLSYLPEGRRQRKPAACRAPTRLLVVWVLLLDSRNLYDTHILCSTANSLVEPFRRGPRKGR